MPKPQKPKPYVVRLEWASTISYCDVSVSARTPAEAIQTAFEECDYDQQDNYDDGGESFATACIPFRTIAQAEHCIDHREAWDYGGYANVPLQYRDPQDIARAHKKHAQHLARALRRSRDMLAKMAGYFTGDALVQVENEVRKLDYLLKVQP